MHGLSKMTKADLAMLRRASAMGHGEARLVAMMNRRKPKAIPASRPQAGMILANFALLIAGLLALLQPWV